MLQSPVARVVLVREHLNREDRLEFSVHGEIFALGHGLELLSQTLDVQINWPVSQVTDHLAQLLIEPDSRLLLIEVWIHLEHLDLVVQLLSHIDSTWVHGSEGARTDLLREGVGRIERPIVHLKVLIMPLITIVDQLLLDCQAIRQHQCFISR